MFVRNSYTVGVLTLALLFAAIAANSMTKPLGHDEQMYCAAGALTAQGKMIYRDFSYVGQMPYHPLLCAALFKTFNTTYYLLTVRLLSAFCDILVVVCILGIYLSLFKSFPNAGILLGLAAALLYVFNPLVDYANGFAWNHDVVILCVVLSFWLFITIEFDQKAKYWRIALIGALLTVATWMRITTALVQLLFSLALLFRPCESRKERYKTALPFLIASACFSIWPLWLIASAPRAFFLNAVWIPMLNGQWQRQINMVHNKFHILLNYVTVPAYLLIIILAIHLYLIILWNRRKLKTQNVANILLAVLLPPTFFIIAFLPPTLLKQYLAMPVPFLILSFAYPLLYLRQRPDKVGPTNHFNIISLVIAACIAVTVLSNTTVVRRIPKLFDPPRWLPVQLHSISADIAQKTKDPKLVLTLAPLYALEGGCSFYHQFSAGVFVYRVADFMGPEDRQTTHTVGTKNLPDLLRRNPPSAVILGTEPKFLEQPLFESALSTDWKTKTYYNGVTAYFRP